MCTFLAINTGSVQLIPITAIAILATAGSKSPYAIVGTTLLATCCSAAAALISVKFFERLAIFRPKISSSPQRESVASVETNGELVTSTAPLTPQKKLLVFLFLAFFCWAFLALLYPDTFAIRKGTVARTDISFAKVINALSVMAIPFLLAFFPFFAVLKGIKVYEEFVEGGKEGFQVAIRIIPYLVAMLVGISMFRGAGGIDIITDALRPILRAINFPPELVPMGLMRPLSGSGSLAIFSELVKQLGPDHLITRMAGTLYGSTETTFYVVAVYFGAVNVQRTRHAIPAGLVADFTGIIASVYICRAVFQ
jgi:spore maturation protein SpmB